MKIEYRWAENHSDRLPALMADLERFCAAVGAVLTAMILALVLFQEPQQRSTGRRTQFLGVQRSILVRIGSVEALLHDSEIFV